MSRDVAAVLFDLDGTLVDTAPDLVATVVWLRARHGLAPIDVGGLGELASRGALALIEAGFSDRTDLDRSGLRAQFLDYYAGHLWQHSRIYPGVEALLDGLQSRGLKLGVVTNKPGALANSVIRAAGWEGRFACLIGGDALAHSKPHPAPVLEACRRLGVAASDAWMVGDDRRDIEAGRRAGSGTMAAAWGYLAGENPSSWAADLVVEKPSEVYSSLFLNNAL